MRYHWRILLIAGTLVSCKKEEPPEEPRISYTREIRPILAAKCLSCHESAGNETGFALSLRDPKIPTTFSFPHPEVEPLTESEKSALSKWLEQGGNIDPHWAFQPLEPSSSLEIPQGATPPTSPLPEGDFRVYLKDTIAGDLLSESGKIFATNTLRQGEDTAWSRLKFVSQFLGTSLQYADDQEGFSLHDHARLEYIFSTPYERLPAHPLKVPTAFRDHQSSPFLWKDHDHESAFQSWLAEKDQMLLIPDLIGAFPFDDGTSSNIALGFETAAKNKLDQTAKGVSGLAVKSPRGVTLPSQASLNSFQPFTVSLWVKSDGTGTLLESSLAGRSIRIGLQDGHPYARITRYWPGNALGIKTRHPVIAPNRWSHLAVTYDGSRSAEGLQLFLNGIKIESLIEANKLVGRVFPEESQTRTKLGGHDSIGVSLDELQIYRRDLSHLEVQTLFNGRSLLNAFQNDADQQPELRHYFLSAISPSARSRRAALYKHLTSQLPVDEVPVMESLPRAPTPETPRTSSPFCLDAVDRLGFITTLIEKDSPLLARATANWVWSQHFGEPLVDSLGYRNAKPANIEKLNQLASRLIELQWDVSQLSEYLLTVQPAE